MGRGPPLVLGRNGAPGLFIYFSFFSLLLFCFLVSFVTFANKIQIKPNHFHKFLQNSQQGFKPTSNMFSEPKQEF
jgi:hypothetical protein